MAAAAVGAAAYDLVTDPVARPGRRPVTPTLFDGTVYCPPAAPELTDGASLAISSASSGDVPVRVEPPRVDGTLDSEHVLVTEAPAEGAPSASVFGGSVVAHGLFSFPGQSGGAGATPCSRVASGRWYFAAGSSALGFDETLLISNPFLDEAVVRVVFYTPKGPVAKAGLADVAVPARRAVQVAVNDYVLRQPLLAAEVLAKRGRVVAWKQQRREDPAGSGGSLTLGAQAAASAWYFPDGALGANFDERLFILNPTEREAIVTITLAAADRVVQPPDLVELSLPPLTAREVPLRRSAPIPRRAIPVGAVVRSINGVEVVAERTVRYLARAESGIAAGTGAARSARLWRLGPAVERASRDAAVILNPGSRPASVRIALLRPTGAPLRPDSLQAVGVPAGRAVRLAIERWTGGTPMAVEVEADRAVVAERSAYSAREADAAAAMGMAAPAHDE